MNEDTPANEPEAQADNTPTNADPGDVPGEAPGDVPGDAPAAEDPSEAERAAQALSEFDITDPGSWGDFWTQNADTFIGLGLGVLKLFAILLIAWIVSGWISKLIRVRGEKLKHVDTTLARFFAQLARWIILVLGFIAALGTVGIETASFAAVLAAAGFAVGFALQGSLSNFAAGVMLLLFRPFKSGDAVKVAGEFGIISEIDLFTTTMDTFDNRRVILPNSNVFGNTIENVSYHTERRVDVNVGVAYDADLDQTRSVLERVANEHPDKLTHRESQVVLQELGGSSVDWTLRVWVNAADYWPAKQELTRRTKVALDEAGLGIPFPQMDVHLFKQNGA